jgi:heterodisulfide reductase subunit C
MATILYLGKQYGVPDSVTVLKALEQAGYRFVRGVGCRGGVCGACAFVYRLPGDARLHGGLICQTTVADGMQIASVPSFPSTRKAFDLDALQYGKHTVLSVYPEVLRCLACGACTQICPKQIDVRDLIARIKRGDLADAAANSMECVMCNLCASRCPVAIPQPEVFLLVRRLYAKYGIAPAADVAERVAEIRAGRFDAELAELTGLSAEELKAQLVLVKEK